MVDRSRWGRGGGGGGRGDNSSDTSSTSSGFPGAGRGWTAHPAPRRPLWTSSVDRSSTPSDKAVAWRDTQKEEVDRLTESKSFLKNNKSFYQLSWPHPPFGILHPPSGSYPKVNLVIRAGHTVSPRDAGACPEGGRGSGRSSQGAVHHKGDGLCHLGKSYSKNLI